MAAFGFERGISCASPQGCVEWSSVLVGREGRVTPKQKTSGLPRAAGAEQRALALLMRGAWGGE